MLLKFKEYDGTLNRNHRVLYIDHKAIKLIEPYQTASTEGEIYSRVHLDLVGVHGIWLLKMSPEGVAKMIDDANIRVPALSD